jgi:hypothetical protein
MDNRLREEAQPKDVREVLRWCGWLVLVISPVVLCMQTFLFAQCDITAPGKVTCSFPNTKMEKALLLFMGVPRSEFADVAAKVQALTEQHEAFRTIWAKVEALATQPDEANVTEKVEALSTKVDRLLAVSNSVDDLMTKVETLERYYSSFGRMTRIPLLNHWELSLPHEAAEFVLQPGNYFLQVRGHNDKVPRFGLLVFEKLVTNCTDGPCHKWETVGDPPTFSWDGVNPNYFGSVYTGPQSTFTDIAFVRCTVPSRFRVNILTRNDDTQIIKGLEVITIRMG